MRTIFTITLALASFSAQGAVPAPDMMDPNSVIYRNHMEAPTAVIIPPAPVSDERCVREQKTAKRKAFWSAVGLWALGSASSTVTATSTSTVRYRGYDGQRRTITATTYSPYIKRELDREYRAAIKGMPGDVAANHLASADCGI